MLKQRRFASDEMDEMDRRPYGDHRAVLLVLRIATVSRGQGEDDYAEHQSDDDPQRTAGFFPQSYT